MIARLYLVTVEVKLYVAADGEAAAAEAAIARVASLDLPTDTPVGEVDIDADAHRVLPGELTGVDAQWQCPWHVGDDGGLEPAPEGELSCGEWMMGVRHG